MTVVTAYVLRGGRMSEEMFKPYCDVPEKARLKREQNLYKDIY